MAGLTLDSLYSLFSSKPTDQWAMSSAENVYGMSLPEIHPEINMTPIPENFFAETSSSPAPAMSENTGKLLAANMLMSNLPGNRAGSPTSTVDSFGNLMMMSSLLAKTKTTAQKALIGGAALKTVAAAGDVFNSIMSLSMGRRNANRQYSNTKLSAENKMAALDNQVMYYKNQIEDKFNTTLARNTAVMAAKNLRVSTGALLEKTKDAAYDATKDIETMESNAELKKIALRNEVKQAKITKELTKSQLTTNLVGSLANLGLMVGTAGGTMESWGDLFTGLEAEEGLDRMLKTGLFSSAYED